MTDVVDRKIALVTGAGSGIGRASARALYRDGYKVVLAGRRLEALQETTHDNGNGNGNAVDASWPWEESRYLLVPTDVTQADQVENLFQQIKDRFGRLDVLFNNAGVGSPPVSIDQVDFATFQSVMATNVTGTFLCCRAAWSIMTLGSGGAAGPRGGRIINNGSISAHSPRPFSAPYTTAKHAITGLTKSLNLDGRNVNICCSQVDIGNAATSMTERMSTTGALQPNGQTMVEPTMSVELVADTIVYLANLPLEANVPFMTIMATQMPYTGRG